MCSTPSFPKGHLYMCIYIYPRLPRLHVEGEKKEMKEEKEEANHAVDHFVA